MLNIVWVFEKKGFLRLILPLSATLFKISFQNLEETGDSHFVNVAFSNKAIND